MEFISMAEPIKNNQNIELDIISAQEVNEISSFQRLHFQNGNNPLFHQSSLTIVALYENREERPT